MAGPGTVTRTPTGFRIDPRVAVPTGVRMREKGRLLIGSGASVDGGVFLAGSLFTQPRVEIRGPVRCRGDVLLGPMARVGGDIEAGGDVRLLPGTLVMGQVRAGGDVQIYDGTDVHGEVKAGGDIVVWGEARTRTLAPGGRLRTEPFVESEPLEDKTRLGARTGEGQRS